MTSASTSSVVPLTAAARISERLRPKVIAPRAGRAASRMATSDSAIAPASVSMCAASESSASESAARPATTSTTMKPRISARATRQLAAVGVGGDAVGMAVMVVVTHDHRD